MKSYIKQISESFPNKKYTNEAFFNDFPNLKDKEETLLKVGVTSRYVIEKNVTASDLAEDAANKMFNEDKINRDEIDFLIFCSTEFDHYTPTTAAILQSRLQLKNSIGAIDIVSSCTGFSHSLSIAKGMIEGNGYKNVLLLCVSTSTKTFHKKDANSHFLFGDAATAILVGSRKEQGIGEFVFGTDGGRHEYIIVRDGGGRTPINNNSFEEEENEYGNITSRANFHMNGTGVFLFSIKIVPLLVNDILTKNTTLFDDIDFFVFHQANEFLLKTLQKKMGIPNEKFVLSMKETGNTVAATIPIALNSLTKNKKVKKGDKVLIAAFGTGLTWGGTIITM